MTLFLIFSAVDINAQIVYPAPQQSSSVTTNFSTPLPPSGSNNGININFIDGIEVEEIWTQDKKDAVLSAANEWTAQIYFNVPVNIDLYLDNTEGIEFLANTNINYLIGYQFSTDPTIQSVQFPPALANEMAGYDVNGSAYEAKITVASDNILAGWDPPTNGTWNTNLNQISNNAYDLKTVVMHEIGHTLMGQGFSGLNFNSQTSEWEGFYPSGFPTILDQFLVRCSDGTPLSQIANNPSSGEILFGLLTGTNGSVCFAGGSGFDSCFPDDSPTSSQIIFEPISDQTGNIDNLISEISHFSESNYPIGDPNSLMTPFTEAGELNHDPGMLMLCLLSQLGYDLNPYYGDGEKTQQRIKFSSTETENLIVWPNPISITSDITLNPAIDFGNASFSYCDMFGKEKGNLRSASELRQMFAKLPTGIYMLNMIENGTIKMQQIIIISK